MQSNERQLIENLFDRLRAVEGQTRDPDVERLIADELRQAPHAVYAMAQTIIMQNQALETAAARIEALEGREGRGGESYDETPARGAMGAPAFGRRGSVPAFGGEREGGRQGGGFLASAGQVAMGVAGGMLMADAARALFGLGGGSEAKAATPATDTAAATDTNPLAQDAGAGDVGRDADADTGGEEGGGGLLGWLFGGGQDETAGGDWDSGGWGGDGGDGGGD